MLETEQESIADLGYGHRTLRPWERADERCRGTETYFWSHVHNDGTAKTANYRGDTGTTADAPTTVGRAATLKMTTKLAQTMAADGMPSRFSASLPRWSGVEAEGTGERKRVGTRRDVITRSAKISDQLIGEDRAQRPGPTGSLVTSRPRPRPLSEV